MSRIGVGFDHSTPRSDLRPSDLSPSLSPRLFLSDVRLVYRLIVSSVLSLASTFRTVVRHRFRGVGPVRTSSSTCVSLSRRLLSTGESSGPLSGCVGSCFHLSGNLYGLRLYTLQLVHHPLFLIKIPIPYLWNLSTFVQRYVT